MVEHMGWLNDVFNVGQIMARAARLLSTSTFLKDTAFRSISSSPFHHHHLKADLDIGY